jgi:transglutaminase-like putative cysteine protease
MSYAPRSLSLREKLSRGLPRDKSDTLLILGACALVIMPHAWHLPGWASLASAALLLWRCWLTFHGRRLPPRWLLMPVATGLMAGVYASYHTFLGREAGVCMLVMLLALKLLEMRARRDLFVVVFLSFFVLLTIFFYSQTIATALLAVVGVIAILTAQISFQYTGAHPPLRSRVALAARMFLLAVPLTLVLFVFFPRIQGPLWGMPGDAVGARTGLSDSMDPGNISELALSAEIAFRARFLGSAPPLPSQMYWRGPVLGHFDGRTWTPLAPHAGPGISSHAGPGISSHAGPGISPHPGPGISPNAGQGSRQIEPVSRHLRYQVTLEPNGRRSLFALDMPRTAPQLPDNPTRLQPDWQILARHVLNARVRYEATSFLEYRLQPDETPLSLRAWLELPPGYNPRTHEYAARLRAQSDQDEELVQAVLRMFRQEGYSYTLRPPRLGRHAVDEFLFDTHAGFCEHYAGAFVVLMRLLDIPARVVTGYQGGELNAVDGFLTVRQSDAHAWAEVWLPQRGWVRVDPTAAVAPDRVERNLAAALPQGALAGFIDGAGGPWLEMLRRLRDNRDALNNSWNQWVLDYTPARQRGLLQSFGIDDPDWGTLAVLLLVTGAAATALVALPLLRRRQKIDPMEALYRTLCQRLARQGWPRLSHEGPRSYRLRLAASSLPEAKRSAVLRFLELYESGRYSSEMARESSTAILHQLRNLLAQSR